MLPITDQDDLPVSLAEVKDYLRIDFNDDDDQIARCMRAGVSFVEHEIEHDIVVRQWTQPFSCFTKQMTLDRSPLLQIDAISYLDEEGEEQAFTNFVIRDDLYRRPIVIPLDLPITKTHPEAVKVEYTTGIDELEHTVKQACLWAAVLFYQHREPEVIGTITSPLKMGLDRLLSKLRAGGYA